MPQNPKFYRYQKGLYVIDLCVTNKCAKFQANIFIFGCEMAQKPSDVLYCIVLKANHPHDCGYYGSESYKHGVTCRIKTHIRLTLAHMHALYTKLSVWQAS